MSDLAARLDVLVPPELTRGDWNDVTRRVRPRARRVTLRVAIAFVLLVVLAAAATATYLILRGHPIRTPTPGALTLSAGGHSIFHPPRIVELTPGGALREVWRCPAKPCGGFLTSVDWAPDGVHVAFALDAFNFRNAVLGLHILDTRSGRHFHVGESQGRRVGCAPAWRNRSSFGALAWSPDSRTLAFQCANSIHTVRADGTEPRRLETGFADSGWPTWSPDGRSLAFQAGRSIYTMRLDGSARRRIVMHGDAPDWSPDGSLIAYEAAAGVRLVTPAGKEVPLRADVPRGAPKWSPDGTRLAVETLRGRSVYVVSFERGRARSVVRVAGPASGAYGPAWYPDQRPRRRAKEACTPC